MNEIRISLFSCLDLRAPGDQRLVLPNRRVEELLCFLLLNRDQLHSRESLADLLWPEATVGRGRSYLRKALWQLQRVMSGQSHDPASRSADEESGEAHWLVVRPEWISVSNQAGLCLDVAAFEAAYGSAVNTAGCDLSAQTALELQQAINLYRGDLLENWYCEWLLVDRERLQLAYIILLEKLMGYSEAHAQIEAGLAYGFRILQLDPAHERAHRLLMRFYQQAGRPAAAIRQYELCASILARELGVSPSQKTIGLYDEILRREPEGRIVPDTPPAQVEIWTRLDTLQAAIIQAEEEVQALRALLI